MTKVTVAIPTLNGAKYIKEAVNSVLKQSYKDFELLVVDNCSADNTKKIINNVGDSRVRYIVNKKQVSIIENWNNCLKNAIGQYILILGDDDIIYPKFLETLVKILDDNKDVGFVYAKCYKMDEKGKIKSPWGYKYIKSGKHSGTEYIIETARQGVNLTNSTTTMINMKVFKKTGLFAPEITDNTFDFNMWLKIANKYSVFFVNTFLAAYREHSGQVSEIHWRGKFPSGRIGAQIEIENALLNINKTDKKIDPKLIEKLVFKSVLRLRDVLKSYDPNL